MTGIDREQEPDDLPALLGDPGGATRRKAWASRWSSANSPRDSAASGLPAGRLGGLRQVEAKSFKPAFTSLFP
jgi:hypothetical protein